MEHECSGFFSPPPASQPCQAHVIAHLPPALDSVLRVHQRLCRASSRLSTTIRAFSSRFSANESHNRPPRYAAEAPRQTMAAVVMSLVDSNRSVD